MVLRGAIAAPDIVSGLASASAARFCRKACCAACASTRLGSARLRHAPLRPGELFQVSRRFPRDELASLALDPPQYPTSGSWDYLGCIMTYHIIQRVDACRPLGLVFSTSRGSPRRTPPNFSSRRSRVEARPGSRMVFRRTDLAVTGSRRVQNQLTTSNKCHASRNKCLTSSNRCLTSSNNVRY